MKTIDTTTTTQATAEDYLSIFDGDGFAAGEAENSALQCGYLPHCAQVVFDGGEATPEYWAWLIAQVEDDD